MTSPPDDTLVFPPGDYVSPGFRRVAPDACFPFMATVDDLNTITWPYYRRWIPHIFRSDRRSPLIGFVSRDEAHILYNTALRCQGQRALEIGCWMGWSACHLALGGVTLDVVDPLLANPAIHASVLASLTAAGVHEHVRLVPEASPAAVMRLHASETPRWGCIFIDGNHDRPGPLHDAMTAPAVAAPDALVLFHDLASPEVAEGLDYLRDQGWNTMLYQTVQIMGVAWRGAARPVDHVPDPRIVWTLPDHLAGYRVCGVPAA
ncbi:MAG: class I SAM-dependent methyltransferase [Acetobacteraceae bacterium]|nr:class I SAM-dependent methyltransferase [Acetobacteraceae bacterium]